MDIQNRVVNFYKNNQFSHSYMLGIDPVTNNVIIGFNGKTKRVSIDVLESFKSEEDIRNYIEDKVVVKEENVVESLPEFNVNEVTIEPTIKEEAIITNNNVELKESLNDIKILNELKNKDGLDNLLKKFAVNESTGLIDINKAISIVTRNTMNEVERTIRNKIEFDSNFSNYDIDGKYIGNNNVVGASTDDEKIFSSFKNIKLYLDAAKMYPDQASYTDEQINVFMRTYISKVKEEVYGKENNSINEVVNNVNPVVNSVSEDVSNNKSAGFADIFVLTVIVLVYAVIIVNLILKLN